MITKYNEERLKLFLKEIFTIKIQQMTNMLNNSHK